MTDLIEMIDPVTGEIQLLTLDEQLGNVEHQIGTAFHSHPQAEIIESMAGMGPILGAELIATAGWPPPRA
nr:hypothetical protein [Agromyces laixinhei]